MDAIDLLLSRNSVPKLTHPAPDGEAWQRIQQAALRAPDHAKLRPWRFLEIRGQAREKLGEICRQVSEQKDPQLTEKQLLKIAQNPMRAPLLVVVITRLQAHEKVPAIEQHASAACAAHGILLAAQAEGYAGIWRTGNIAFEREFMRRLGLADNEHISGFLYLGSADGAVKPVPQNAIVDYWQSWTGKL